MGDRGRQGRNDWHQRAAEFHDLAAHAHRAAATHHGKDDHETGHEHSKRATEYSAKAHQSSQEALNATSSGTKEMAKGLRIENELIEEDGDGVKLKKGAHVEVTVTAESTKTARP